MFRYLPIFALTVLYSLPAFSVPHLSLSYRSMGILDDEMVRDMRTPNKPCSVSQVLDGIREEEIPADLEVLDLAGNNISTNGAKQVFKFARDEAPNLRRLSLSYNRIYDDAATDDEFLNSLVLLLALPNFEELNLTGNGVASLSFLQQITPQVADNIRKLKIDL